MRAVIIGPLRRLGRRRPIALSRYRHNTAAHSATSPERFAVWNSPTTGAEIAAIAKQRQSRTPTILNAASTAASISTANVISATVFGSVVSGPNTNAATGGDANAKPPATSPGWYGDAPCSNSRAAGT